MKIKEIIDSKTDITCGDGADLKNCGVVYDADGSNCPSVKEMRASQQRRSEGTGTQAGNYNDQERPFAQNYDDGGSDDETPSDDSEAVPGLGF